MTHLEIHIQNYFNISRVDCAKVAMLFKQETIKKNEFWQKSGKKCEKMSFISKGMMRLYVSQKNRDVTQWIASEGYFLTDISAFLLGNPATYNIQALVDTELFTISSSDYELLNSLVPQWGQLEKIFICKCFMEMERRILDLLSLSAPERYHQLFEYNRELFNQAPMQHLASMLGMTPETFSRIRRKAIS